MKLLHTADLHLGKVVNGYRMTEDQQYILKEIIRIAVEEDVDAIMISGDIYDRRIPPEDAVNLFDRFLSKLNDKDIKVLIISGNHDSAERISFGEKLMEKEGIYISYPYNGTVKSTSLDDEYGRVNFYLLPFIKPIQVRSYLKDEGIETYTDAVRAVVSNLDIDTDRRNIILSHQFVTGGILSESEEISIGGIDNVDYDVYDCFDYVALGHLHSHQKCKRETLRYPGTPLKYSFDEHDKSVTLVDLGAKGEVQIYKKELCPLRDLRTIRGSFDEIIEGSRTDNKRDDYINVILTDEREVIQAYYRIKDRYPRLMMISYENTRTSSKNNEEVFATEEKKNPLEYAAELFKKQNGRGMSENQLEIMKAILTDAKGEI